MGADTITLDGRTYIITPRIIGSAAVYTISWHEQVGERIGRGEVEGQYPSLRAARHAIREAEKIRRPGADPLLVRMLANLQDYVSPDRPTPGPWEIGGALGESVWAPKARDDGDYICEAPDADQFETSYARWPANARLIVAAPDLLAFAQEIALGAYGREEAYHRARELVAKALGDDDERR